MAAQPSLFLALAEEQTARIENSDERYDADRDELFVQFDGRWIPAATHPFGPPKTKKADIERGEDMKHW